MPERECCCPAPATEPDRRESCTCDRCQESCRWRPGLFLPGEIEAVAAYLDMSLSEFFAKFVMVAKCARTQGDHLVLSPAILRGPGADLLDPRGQCVFYQENGLCAIHPVKPHECWEMHCGMRWIDAVHLNNTIAGRWWLEENQQQIRDLVEGKENES